jgi:nucleoside-diphosphate-sugar epimerase
VDIDEEIAGVRLVRRYNLDRPKGVRGRNADNTLIQHRLGWKPSTPLAAGLKKTYNWIDTMMTRMAIAMAPAGTPTR